VWVLRAPLVETARWGFRALLVEGANQEETGVWGLRVLLVETGVWGLRVLLVETGVWGLRVLLVETGVWDLRVLRGPREEKVILVPLDKRVARANRGRMVEMVKGVSQDLPV
jgi:hypothetical protein